MMELQKLLELLGPDMPGDELNNLSESQFVMTRLALHEVALHTAIEHILEIEQWRMSISEEVAAQHEKVFHS